MKWLPKCVAVMLMTVVLSSNLVLAADEDTPEVCAFYAGEYSPADAELFHSKFTGSPTYYADKGLEEWSEVSLNDLKDGVVGDDGVDDADLAYYSSHGYYAGDDSWFEIWDESGNVLWEVRASDVGDAWIEDVSYWGTNSAWDADFEWMFLACCNQLRTDYSFTAPKAWGRVLCGYPRRGHGLFGYCAVAPGDGTDESIVARLYSEGVTSGRTIKTAWVNANVAYGQSTKWACVIHSANVNDHFWNSGTVTADTSPSSSPVIYYYNSTYSSGYEVVGVFNRLWAWISGTCDRLAGWFGNRRVSAAAAYGSRQMRLTCPLPRAESATAVSCSPESPPDGGWASVILGPGFATAEPAGDSTGRWAGDRWTLESFPSGAIQVSREMVDEVCTFDAKHAIALAEDYLALRGGLPSESGRPRVAAIRRTAIDLVDDVAGPSESVGFIVEYPHVWQGTQVAGDAIRVVIDAQGVANYLRNWHDIGASIRSGHAIPALDAVRAACEDIHWALKVPLGASITRVSQGMYAGEIDDAPVCAVPVWDIEVEGDGHVYVNALTGEVVH